MQDDIIVFVKVKRELDGHDCWGKNEYSNFYYLYTKDMEFIGKFNSLPQCNYKII